jgi:twitching motility protein PilT
MHIDQILKKAVELNASDIHVSAGLPPMFRLAGELSASEFAVLSAKDIYDLLTSMVTVEQKESFEKEWELDFSYAIKDLSRFRVNVYREKDGPGMAIRIVPSKIPTPEEIGLSQSILSFTKLRNGLVLVTGPTGSGKSTTLATMIDLINHERSCHIVTVEDPIEFTYANQRSIVHQRELNAHTRSFAGALKHLLRQDPNVVLVGEMRDLETIATAITVAETGHLVFATLHTLDAAQTIDRMIDVFPPHQQQQIRIMLSGALKGVISQHLLPRKDGQGRVAAREQMVVSPAISNLIREGKTHQIYSAIQTGGSLGMVTMELAVNRLVQDDLISEDIAAGALNELGH